VVTSDVRLQLAADPAQEDQVVRKAFNRIVPILFVLMMIAIWIAQT